MTLILSHVARYGVIHVSDRLLTLRGTNASFDAHSNKALLYLCTDAIVAIGYTGIAYVGDSPADVWIAHQLIGKEFEEPSHFGLPLQSEPRNIVSAVELLRTRLESEMRRTSAAEFGILVTGWKWPQRKKPKRAEPFVATVRWNGDHMATETLPRYWRYVRGRDELLACIPANIEHHRAEEVMKSLNQCSDSVSMRNILIETIRSISGENATVGPDCMSIMLTPPNLLLAEIEFVFSGSGLSHGEVYAPWVITPGYVHAPSILFGGWEIHDGPWTIYLKDDVRGFAPWAIQKRPKRPR